MNRTLIQIARITGLTLTELNSWGPRDIATMVEILDNERIEAKQREIQSR